ncbi:cytochrome P450 [Pholiota conissans]|uniref:Cytochrome P450 n=2 Tax=Pholiota conissans TaxID=109636 RepID=A0A9P6CRE1_9AGAR|nr:cytochrome P450 [Pholiota conissans]
MNHSGSTTFFTILLLAYATHLWMKSYNSMRFKHFIIALLVVPAIPTYLNVNRIEDKPLSLIFRVASASYLAFYAALIVCVVVYRLSPFHPLAKYPGPIIMRMTKLWGGPTIRNGPNELSTIEKELIPQILGNRGMPKGPLWGGRSFSKTESEYDSLIALRDTAQHTALHKPWNQAFGAGPIQDYEPLPMMRVVELNRAIENAITSNSDGIGQVNISKIINCFSFDFMGDLAFGGAFHLMKSGDTHPIHLMEDGHFLISLTQHVPWAAKFLHSMPIINSDMQQFLEFGLKHSLNRANMNIDRKDLFYHIAETFRTELSESDLSIIISNAILAIVAGSDTTSTVLCSAIYFLLKNPEVHERLQNEIDAVFGDDKILDVLRDELAASRRRSTPAESVSDVEQISDNDIIPNDPIHVPPNAVTDIVAHLSGSQQHRFRITFNKDALTASSSRASSYFEWTINTDPKEIDTEENYKAESAVPDPNPIEQRWGRAKSVYRTYPPSSREDDLEKNTLRSLDGVPPTMIRPFATRSRRFMDAYERGLNGKQAARAAKKYRGHPILPQNILDELEMEGIV